MAPAALTDYLRIYDDSLEPELCRRMIASFHDLARFHQPNGRGYGAALNDSAWTELNVSRLSDPSFAGFFRHKLDRALERYNADLQLSIAVPNSPKTADLIMKRYQPGTDQRFQLHFDSVHDVANRYLVLLWYLNDVERGGETVFPDLGQKIRPREGRLIMFPPYWMYQHAGLPPESGEKYILSTYLLF
jgi:prolyl 4-hydroxylase